jgi:multidrug efflux pump subunit AcrB
VERGYEDPPTFLIRQNGEPALVLGVIMRDGWNGLDLGKALDAEQKKIDAELPLGGSFSKVTNQAVDIREAVDEFMLKFFVALAVVMIVSLASLGWRVGIVVAAAVPLTLSALFVIMLLTGREFDRISLGAIILALGLLVDDAIIAIEMMLVKMEAGQERTKAASFAWSHTAAPMLAGTFGHLTDYRRADADWFRTIERWGMTIMTGELFATGKEAGDNGEHISSELLLVESPEIGTR